MAFGAKRTGNPFILSHRFFTILKTLFFNILIMDSFSHLFKNGRTYNPVNIQRICLWNEIYSLSYKKHHDLEVSAIEADKAVKEFDLRFSM